MVTRSNLMVILFLWSAYGSVRASVPDGEQLEEITVTAQKRAESSQNVPMTINTGPDLPRPWLAREIAGVRGVDRALHGRHLLGQSAPLFQRFLRFGPRRNDQRYVDSLIKSEVAQTVEVGIKSSLLEHRLRVNASIFHTAISNFQDTLFTGAAAGFITENLPARSKGVEFETAWQASRDLSLAGAVTYSDATETRTALDAVLVPSILCHVCRATQAPTWNATSGGLPTANYSLPQPAGRGAFSLSRVNV
jgi:hypothetical protein